MIAKVAKRLPRMHAVFELCSKGEVVQPFDLCTFVAV